MKHVYYRCITPKSHFKLWLNYISIQGSHPTWENLEFCHLLFQGWKMSGICSKSWKTWNFNSKPGNKTCILEIWYFQIQFSRCLYKKIIYIYVIYKLSTPTLWFETKLTWDFTAFTCNCLENTWHFVSAEKWEPCYTIIVNLLSMGDTFG